MNTVSIFIVALCLAMDAFGVAISNCMLLKNMPLRVAFKFGFFFGAFQFIMPVIGYVCGVGLSAYIMRISNWISLGLLVAIGGKMVYESFHRNTECDINDTAHITSVKNLTILGIATSIDALAVGVTFALEGANIWFASAIIGVVAFVLSTAGAIAGSKLQIFSPKYAERLGGFILIGIGIKIFLGV